MTLRETQLDRLVFEAHAAFCDMHAGDSRWMLEAQILLESRELPRAGLEKYELRRILEIGERQR